MMDKNIIFAIKELIYKEVEIQESEIVISEPPKYELGDLSIPLFKIAKKMNKKIDEIGNELTKIIEKELKDKIENMNLTGGYLNIRLSKKFLIEELLKLKEEKFSIQEIGKGRKIMVEYFSPNTNKPLHVGHLRNLFIGEAVSSLLEKVGFDVIRAVLYNDRGIHISKTQVAYRKWREEFKNISKGDHYLGALYVKYSKELEKNPDLEEEARELLLKWEQGDEEILKEWEFLRNKCIEGFEETLSNFYAKPFDIVYFESDYWDKAKEIVLEYYKKGIFKKDESGAIIAVLKNGEKRPVLRADGTTLYLTQDIYLAYLKNTQFHPLYKSIYVVAREQEDHFNTLFQILQLLNYPWASNGYHLAYGMVLVEGGRLKSREGVTVDADELFNEIKEKVKNELKIRYKEMDESEKEETAKRITNAILRWGFLKVSPIKDINFDKDKALSLKENTGIYILYTFVRTHSLLSRSEVKDFNIEKVINYKFTPFERKLTTKLLFYPYIIQTSAERYDPSILVTYIYNLSSLFNRIYHELSILTEETGFRLLLTTALKNIIYDSLHILNIPPVSTM